MFAFHLFAYILTLTFVTGCNTTFLRYQTFFWPSKGSCNCRQSYTGEEDMLLVARLTPYHKHGQNTNCDIMTYPLLNTYTNRFGRESSLRNCFNSLVVDQTRNWGKAKKDCIPWSSFRLGMWKFWEKVIDLNLPALYTCPKCGGGGQPAVRGGVGPPHMGKPS